MPKLMQSFFLKQHSSSFLKQGKPPTIEDDEPGILRYGF
jgi:hypothetical protein